LEDERAWNAVTVARLTAQHLEKGTTRLLKEDIVGERITKDLKKVRHEKQ
jgi:hypothetical protein